MTSSKRVNLIAFAYELYANDMLDGETVDRVADVDDETVAVHLIGKDEPRMMPRRAIVDIQRRVEDIEAAKPAVPEQVEPI